MSQSPVCTEHLHGNQRSFERETLTLVLRGQSDPGWLLGPVELFYSGVSNKKLKLNAHSGGHNCILTCYQLWWVTLWSSVWPHSPSILPSLHRKRRSAFCSWGCICCQCISQRRALMSNKVMAFTQNHTQILTTLTTGGQWSYYETPERRKALLSVGNEAVARSKLRWSEANPTVHATSGLQIHLIFLESDNQR